jgi:DNA-binding transcriptional LysR family regulator
MEISMNFDTDCLRSFLVIADTMSFSRAAETVGRSQSTISQQIAKLETQVGKPLLTRRKGRVLELTSEGGKLVQFARKILQLNDEAYASMSDEVLTGLVRLGVPLDFFGRDFTTWLARFKNRHPMVGLEVEANQSENLMKRSMRGEFDLAFFKQETGAKNGTVALREQLVWVSGPNYSGDDNESVPLILFPEGCAYRRCAIGALKDHKRSWHLSFVAAANGGIGLFAWPAQQLASRQRVGELFGGPVDQCEACDRGDLGSKHLNACVYRKLKHGRSGGEVRRGWRVN